MNSSGHRHSPIHSGLGTVDAQAMGILGHLDPRDCQYRAALPRLQPDAFPFRDYQWWDYFHHHCDLFAGRWQCAQSLPNWHLEPSVREIIHKEQRMNVSQLLVVLHGLCSKQVLQQIL